MMVTLYSFYSFKLRMAPDFFFLQCIQLFPFFLNVSDFYEEYVYKQIWNSSFMGMKIIR